MSLYRLMSKKEWGSVTWTLFHCLAEKINDNSNEQTIELLITNIKLICNNLPCPNCQQHAKSIWNKYHYIKINTKEKLK